MKVIVAGSRTIFTPAIVAQAILKSGFKVTEVVSGCAPGVDTLGEKWAEGHKVPVRRFPAQWGLLGKEAGPARNEAMARYANALVAIWDGRSPGTRDMIERAKANGLAIHIERA